MGRQKIVAGNWKMHTTIEEGIELASAIRHGASDFTTQVILAPPCTHLSSLTAALHGCDIKLAAQNCHFEDSGAYTGEVSPLVLKAMRIDNVILGHSERRQYFQEESDLLLQKLLGVLKNDLVPIFCCGENLEIRQSGNEKEYVKKQLEETIFKLSEDHFGQIVIAYEPVWAIGTGLTASPEQAEDMHAFIRGLIADKLGAHQGEQTSILYGGSVKPGNAGHLFAAPNVDGALVGGASLNAEDFLSIIRSSERS